MSESPTVREDQVVLFHYVLKGDDGQIIDASGNEPLAYLHGHGNIVPGLERQLLGRTVGEEVQAVVPPGEAYGELQEDAYESVHRSQFPKEMNLEVGMPLRAQGSDGHPVTLWISKIEGARVTVTANHPLAGRTLHFDVRIAGIRAPSSEELAHGHVHGAGGHHH